MNFLGENVIDPFHIFFQTIVFSKVFSQIDATITGISNTIMESLEKCLSLTNNWIVLRFWGLGASGVRSKVWVLTIKVPKANPERDSVWDGLWRPGGAFFQIGLGCVMSHHHREGLCTFLFKFWRENSIWSACQQLVTKKDYP